MEKEYYTIKEYADLKGVSYQAVYKRLKTTLQPYVETVEGRKVLRAEALSDSDSTPNSTVKSTVDSTVQNVFNPSPSALEEELKRINARNEDLIDDLRSEIKSKDKQIEEMSVKIANLFETHQRLVERNQQLQMNYQLLLGNATEQVDEAVDVEGARLNEEPEEPKKKGLFSRLFK